MTIQSNLRNLKELITEHEVHYQRTPHSVHLLAVSKGQSLDKIKQAIHAGQTSFGENYLQEALEKIQLLADKNIEWHFIGKIQSNKTKKIAEHFNWVQSLDDVRIAKRLNDQRPAHLPPLNVCIEVNISEQATKSGIQFAAMQPLAEYISTLPRLRLRGLMASPATHRASSQATLTGSKHEFHQLFTAWQSLRKTFPSLMIDTLSMGMSDDFEAAIAEGATMIRLGTAIFGSR